LVRGQDEVRLGVPDARVLLQDGDQLLRQRRRRGDELEIQFGAEVEVLQLG
jgi:hypothetical protein